MKNSLLFKFAFCLLAFSVILTSCSKEDSEVIEETKEPISSTISVTLRGTTTDYDAYAAYCNVNGNEAFAVSNNASLLENDTIQLTDFAEDDFLIFYFTDGTTSSTIGGTTFSVDLGGQTTLSTVLDAEADVTIDEADSSAIAGSMTGTFYVFDPTTGGTQSNDYSVDFNAEVDPSFGLNVCE